MSEDDDPILQIRRKFPNLSSSAAITSPPSSRYNCIAFAAGSTTEWWWPDAWGFAYWPPGCRRMETIPAFQQAFEALGYGLCPTGNYEEEFEKIVIYHLNGVPKHAARQLDKDHWCSKLGEWFDIRHTPSCLSGRDSSYGEVGIFMKRRKF